MLKQAIVTTVDFCTRYARQVIGIAALLAIVGGVYAAAHFAIDADVNKLISKDLPWRQREAQFESYFPPKEETTLAVIDARTSELASQATAALIQKLSEQKPLFHSIMEAGGGPFFQKNGLLFLPTPEVVELTKKLGEAKPIIQSLAQQNVTVLLVEQNISLGLAICTDLHFMEKGRLVTHSTPQSPALDGLMERYLGVQFDAHA